MFSRAGSTRETAAFRRRLVTGPVRKRVLAVFSLARRIPPFFQSLFFLLQSVCVNMAAREGGGDGMAIGFPWFRTLPSAVVYAEFAV